MRAVRVVAIAVLFGTVNASAIFMISVAANFPRVWPGTAVAFLTTSSLIALHLSRGRA